MFEALSLLKDLNDSDLNQLLDMTEERQVISGTQIIQEGKTPDSLFIVAQGLVGVSLTSASGSYVARLGPGELLGEISLLEGTPATASVSAIENTLLLVIPQSKLQAWLTVDPGFATRWYRAVALILSRRLRERVSALTEQLRTKEERDVAVSAAWQPTLQAIRDFKELLLKLDQQCLKDGPLSDEVVAELSGQFQSFVSFLNVQIGDSSGLDEHVRNEIGTRLGVELHAYLLLTGTAERFYSKPRGYAGDFLTIEQIYQNQARGNQRLGPVLDRWFLDGASAIAVRNRRGLLAREIRRTCDETETPQVRICTLACGPAEEVFDVLALPEVGQRIRPTLIDIDQDALAFVRNKAIGLGCLEVLRLVEGNLVYLAAGRQKIDNLLPQDLVYSIGLIDYFNDKWVVKLINYVHSLLRPGGRVILGNFHPDNPTKAFMDYVLDWRLIHRTEEDMNRLFSQSEFGRMCTNIYFEDQRINLFAECIKETAS